MADELRMLISRLQLQCIVLDTRSLVLCVVFGPNLFFLNALKYLT